ncbi:MAG: TIM barrel protein [Actinomycetota bacterium]
MILCSSGVFFERERTDAESILDYGPQLPVDGLEVLVTGRMVPILEETTEHLRSSGLTFPVIHAPKPVGARLPADEAIHELKATCRFARAIGSSLVVLHLWDLPDSDRDLPGRLEAATLAADIAADVGIEIAIETIPCTYATPLANIECILEHEPRARVTLDTEFLAYHDEVESALDVDWLWRDGIVRHIHLKDYDGSMFHDDGKRRYLPAGDGAIAFGTLFDRLNERGFTGSVSLECVPKNGRTIDIAATARLLGRISNTPWAFAK